MECNKCKNSIVLDAFSQGKCEICKTDVSTSHMPCDKLCEDCSTKNKRCKSCGKEMNMFNVTGKELGGLLFSIHHHIDQDENNNQRDKIIYYEEDVLELLEALGFPKVEWGECITIEDFKNKI